ncbi:unnamed protein product [Trifolium pratense]|uniref:Uncharacterized protein n=1 Tax=Trifolium pratense TaxID=57577 RepID=A0ACB0K8A5_TRIPR|nr:unnamed protein product [Trifolium pratense]
MMICIKSYGSCLQDLWWMFLILVTEFSTFLKVTWNKQLQASTDQELNQEIPHFNLPSKILCRVVNVQLLIVRDSKEDSGRFSGLLSSSDSLCVGVSRTSSKLSFQDELDDNDFSCPFDVDDVDPPDVLSSHNVYGKSASESPSTSLPIGRKSQDAAVCVLVHMLRTAPPLRQDSSCYSSHSLKAEVDGGVATASGFFMLRKTTDALEELRSYREMRDLLLSKSGTRILKRDET